MPTDQSAPAQPANGQQLRPLWFSVLVGPIAYSIYFLAGYMTAEAACKADLLTFTIWGMDGLAATEALLTLLTMFVIAVGFVIAWRTGRAAQTSEESAPRFLAFGGLVLNPLFLLVTGATGGALIFLQPCSWM